MRLFSLFSLSFVAACLGGPTKDSETPTDTDTCETLPGRCGQGATGDTGCPDGYTCWGPSAFVCYRGVCDLPICLAPTTRIWTPQGERALWTLRRGDPVWTLDADGNPVVAPIRSVQATLAPAEHRVVRVALADGRTVVGSPMHPTAVGTPLADLMVGEWVDGAVVTSVALEPYDFRRTFDLLPAGPTGTYRADGVWLGSTLGPSRGP